MEIVDLILIGTDASTVNWPLGRILSTDADPTNIDRALNEVLKDSSTSAVLCWNIKLGSPDSGEVLRLLDSPVDVWHSGLLLGTSGQPGIIDFVSPTWMLNRDPDSSIEATSWRISLNAALIRTEVLRQMGTLNGSFSNLQVAGLELGHRFITKGVLVRYSPSLVQNRVEVEDSQKANFVEEVKFIYHRYGRFWTLWALIRVLLSQYVSVLEVLSALRVLLYKRENSPTFRRQPSEVELKPLSVSIVIPTLDRYPYLRKLLQGLKLQRYIPYEIIIVDQTEESRRETTIAEEFSDLPLKLFYQKEPGQCSSRNRALNAASGDCILFLDDDDEVQPDLIEYHVANLQKYEAEVSCGVADEIGAGPLPENFRYLRFSDVFPTNNTMIRREILEMSGLFDLAYDRGQRADGDLGMRIYLSGCRMILDPSISVLHHHAPTGGLRQHNARVITYAISRRSLFKKQIPSVTEMYLAKRYFTPRQVSEMVWMRAAFTFVLRGQPLKKVLKFLLGLLYLPLVTTRILKNANRADDLLKTYPQIPYPGSSNESPFDYQ
jgi:glycosyltransferase involved in cell wall biosynthesis